jgi:hypothetical protein
MPNWCSNKITIRANKKTREEIKKFLCGMIYHRQFSPNHGEITPLQGYPTLFSFHKVIPQPDFILDPEDPRRLSDAPKSEEKTDGMPDWWNWRVNNWGTKWDTTEVDLVETEVSMTYTFDTAWAPPEPVVRRLSEKFPNAHITMSFYEPGCIGRGSASFKDGFIVRETGVGVS